MPRRSRLTIATVNVNGLRAAANNGIKGWLDDRRPDIVTMQEVRAPDALVPELVKSVAGPAWSVAHDECEQKGRAGVAVASHRPIVATRSGLQKFAADATPFSDSGRWIEVDFDTADGRGLTVISSYVHTGDAESPARMSEKLAFMRATTKRLQALKKTKRHVLLTGDLNVAHREVDLKNWKGNLKSAGFLPEERAWFDELFDRQGWVDVARKLSGDGPGPYSWWSWRGKAFDTNAGWRIDYHIASPDLADAAVETVVDRAPSYAERWSDHAPVVVTYLL
jgi:exodeoxyribonuclease-3